MIATDNYTGPFMLALTPSERMVAIHLVQGLSNKEISSLLSKAEATVKHQISSIMEKTGVPSRARFIALYYQELCCPLPVKFANWSCCPNALFLR